MKTPATKLIVPALLFATAPFACEAATDPPTTLHDTQKVAITLSVPRSARRVEPPEDFRFNHGRTVQFIERTRFTHEDREKLRALHDEFLAAGNTPPPAAVACPQAQRYAQRILDRLIDASGLRQSMLHADYPVQLIVTCGLTEFPDAQIKAGVMEVSAELILAMPSEDEIAAMMGHELAHYTLAHEAIKLEVYARLTRYSLRALSIDHEIEADAEGLVLLANAGYDPYAAVDALKMIRAIVRGRWLQTDAVHPELDERIRALQQQITHAGLQTVPRRTQGLAAIQEEIRRRPAALLRNARALGAPD